MQDALVDECAKAEEQGITSELPWILAPYQLVTWWDMEKFSAEAFVLIGTLIQQLKEEMGLPESDAAFSFTGTKVFLSPEKKDKIKNCLDFIESHCHRVSLTICCAVIAQVRDDFLCSEELPRDYAIGRIAGFEGTLRAEMQANVFLAIASDRKIYFQHPVKDWSEVVLRFPKMINDITESKCFACDRYAASIFHILLVAEFGVIEVAKVFGVQGDKPGWGALERLERIHKKDYRDKSDLEKQHAQFLAHVMPLMFAIKDSWRHKISHVENKLEWLDTVFSPQITEEIISATRGFMRRLATDLP